MPQCASCRGGIARQNRAVTDPPADPPAGQRAPGFSVKPALTGERVLLRPFMLDADAPRFARCSRTPRRSG
jgi:hypothetical protein